MPTRADLRTQIKQIAETVHGKVGVAAALLEGGPQVGLNSGGHFPMQSVYKLPIAMRVMSLIEQKKLSLTQVVMISKADLVPKSRGSGIRDAHPEGGIRMTVRELLEAMMVPSDGTACDVLLRLSGEAEASTRYLRLIGLKDIVVATTEGEMAAGERVQYRNWATPDAMIALLRALEGHHALRKESQALLLEMMSSPKTIQTRIAGLLPKGTVVAHKTGSSGSVNGFAAATNDVGIVTLPDGRHMLLAIFVSDTRADGATRDAAIAKIAKACWDHWTLPAAR
jgi:beta-lactamase class A